LNERVSDAERRLSEIDSELATLEGNLIDEAEVAAALTDFDAEWDCLTPREQARVVELLVEQVVYDHERGGVAIAFRETGIKTLAAELAKREEKAA
jgi:site-specific DNA recombinase